MLRTLLVAASTLVFANASWAATSISPGGTVNGTVLGTTAIYQIFGHDGSPGGGGVGTDAILLTFTAGAGNVFTFSASGATNCCSGTPTTPPDGTFAGTNVGGANGLSSSIGDTQLPLLGVFTTDTDPFGGAAPAALVWAANTPSSLAPLLSQTFYIGDGKSGYQNGGGSVLQFTAPATATRLYLGLADALGFAALTGFYADNPGSYDFSASLTNANVNPTGAVPEPETYALMLAGLGLLGFAARRRRQQAA